MTDAMKRIEELRKVIQSRDEMTTGVMELFDLAESLAAELEQIRGAGDEEVERHFVNLRRVFGNDDAMAQSLAADAIYALRKTLITRGRERDAALKRVKELEAENEDVQHAMGVLERAGFTGFELPLKPETAKDAASKAIVYRVEL